MKTLFLLFFLFLSSFVMSQNGKYLGQVKINTLQAGQKINYNIMSGNIGTAFRIDPSTGNLFINNQTAIDNYPNWRYKLVIRLRYSINNVIIADTLREITILNFVNNKFVYRMIASDQDMNQKLSYRIMSGNYSTAFKINSTTGDITVANANVITNWIKTKDRYVLNIRVTDNGVPSLTNNANLTVLLFGDQAKIDVFNCR